MNAHTSLVEAVITRLTLAGWAAWPTYNAGVLRRDETGQLTMRPNPKARGAADVSAVMPPVGHALFIECKTGNAVLGVHQKRFRDKVQAMGATYLVARSITDVDDFVRDAKRAIRRL